MLRKKRRKRNSRGGAARAFNHRRGKDGIVNQEKGEANKGRGRTVLSLIVRRKKKIEVKSCNFVEKKGGMRSDLILCPGKGEGPI